MFDFLGRKRKNPAKPTSVVPAAQPSTTQRDMLRLAVQNVLRHNGIPGHWISCESMPIQPATSGQAVMVQLVVRQWHDALMHYAIAIEHGIVNSLKRIDPTANPANYRFSWQFAPDCGCPHTEFPKHVVWVAKTAAAQSISPTPSTSAVPVAAKLSLTSEVVSMASAPTAAATRPKFDLPRTAADLPRTDDDDDDDHGFAATQINHYH